MRSTHWYRPLAAAMMAAVLLLPGTVSAARPQLTGSITHTINSAACASYGVQGAVSWSGGRVGSVTVELGENNGFGSLSAVYDTRVLRVATARRGSVAYSFSGVAMPNTPPANVALVAKFLLGGNQVGTVALTPLGSCTLPDLTVSAIAFTAPSNFPSPHSYTVTVRNDGAAPANISGVGVQGYYSTTTGAWPTNQPACGTSFNTNLAPLAAGATINIAVGCSTAPGTGDLFLNVKVDNSGNFVVESDETNNVGSTPVCSFTAGTSGCIVLTNVAITDSASTPTTYTLSGRMTFTPTCANGVGTCSYAYPNIVITGSGTFSVSGSQTASGTWTVPAQPNDRPNPSPYQFTNGGAASTCALADIRQITANIPLVASGTGDTGGQVLSIRQDTVGTTSRVRADFSTGPLPTGTFQNPFNSLAGVTIRC